MLPVPPSSSTLTVSTTIPITGTIRELESIDWARQLRAGCCASTLTESRGASSEERRSPPAVAQRVLFPVAQRSVDQEIVRLARKGLALGKHLTCAGMKRRWLARRWRCVPMIGRYRDSRFLGAFLVRGVRPAQLLAQACGRVNGLTGGWDGSLHMGSRPHRIAGLVSHLGTLVAYWAAARRGSRYRGTDNVVLAFAGEGSTSTGDFHEALNLASVLALPLVVVVENNQWAFGTPSRLQYAVSTWRAAPSRMGPAWRAIAWTGRTLWRFTKQSPPRCNGRGREGHEHR